jgi:hypothetical protein
MGPRPRAAGSDDEEGEPEEALQAPAPTEAAPAAHYRVAGNLEVRSVELEQELAATRARLAEMERRVWAANAIVRKRRVASMLSGGGLGAFVATVGGWVAQPLLHEPYILLVGSVVGFCVGVVATWRADPPDDGFPPAPPERLR